MSARPRATCTPDWSFERGLYRLGSSAPAGLDEAGRGCLAGPVIAAAVILRPGAPLAGVRDSKLLTPARRASLLRTVLRGSVAWALGAADAVEIDRMNILNATRLAMTRATQNLAVRPDHLLLDAVRLPAIDLPQTPLIGGDRRCLSIAAASILAKVARDRVMEFLDRLHPGYGFARHKGYGTMDHYAALRRRGASPLHRLTFAGVVVPPLLPFEMTDLPRRPASARPA